MTAVRELAPDLLGVQEIVVDEADTPREQWDAIAAQTIIAFAADCGLTAEIPATAGYPHGVTMAANAHRAWYTAVLWNPDTISYAPGSYRPVGNPDFWHGLTMAAFDIGAAEPLTMVSYHGDPFRPNWRAEEARRLKGLLRVTGGAKHAVVVGDFNALSAPGARPGRDTALLRRRRGVRHAGSRRPRIPGPGRHHRWRPVGRPAADGNPAAQGLHGRRGGLSRCSVAADGRALEGRPGRPRPLGRTPYRSDPRHPPRRPRTDGVRRPRQRSGTGRLRPPDLLGLPRPRPDHHGGG
ncbi:endonuclease/exonuclease/phosphatase family protein [Streptomyces luteogriseus]|uniref:endonuclease/exonuclease/phosphatase family protein n=1 Tax=Streptomyces luteogriseus TaxID=68233 RepID=UPI0037A5923C